MMLEDLSKIIIALLLPFALWSCGDDDAEGGGSDGDADGDSDGDTDGDADGDSDGSPDPDPAAPFAVMELFTSEG